jgi:hypothetical protein
MELTVPALESSFDLVAPHGEQFMNEFYARLFETAPAVVGPVRRHRPSASEEPHGGRGLR